MSRKEITIITDDLTGEEGAEARTFSLGGETFSIDLTPDSYMQLEEVLLPFIERGTRVRPNIYTPMKKGDRNDPAYIQAVRRWAAENDIAVPSRGRIPTTVLVAYARRAR